MRDGNIVLELRGDTLCLGEQSTVLSGDLRTFALVLGHSPCKAVSYKELNAAVYDEQYGQNTDRLRQLASELRRRLAALGLTPTNEYLPQGSRLGYVLMVSVEERLHSPSAERAAVETLRPEADGHVPLRPSAFEQVCPYRGLDVFHEEDAPYFAGREAFSDELGCLVPLAIATTVETVPGDLAGGRFDRCHADQVGESALAVQPVRVVAGYGQQRERVLVPTPLIATNAGAAAATSWSRC